MSNEIVPVQVKIWFPDGGFYDLHGVLEEFRQDNDYDARDWGMHTIHRLTEARWTLSGKASTWEFAEDGRPDLLASSRGALLIGSAGLGGPAWKNGDPDRSTRARKRARARARRQRDQKAVHRDRPA